MKFFQKISKLGFSNDGLLLWALVANEVIVHDALAGEIVIPRMRALRSAGSVASSADGRRLATAGEKAVPRLWDLSPARGSADDLRAIATALSSHSLVDGTSALTPLRQAELHENWQRTRELLGGWQTAEPEADAARKSSAEQIK